MRKNGLALLCFLGVIAGLATGCATQRAPDVRGGESRRGGGQIQLRGFPASYVNGMVSSCDNDSITISGIQRQTKLRLIADTAYYSESLGDPADLAVGEWLLVQTDQDASELLHASTVKIYEAKPCRTQFMNLASPGNSEADSGQQDFSGPGMDGGGRGAPPGMGSSGGSAQPDFGSAPSMHGQAQFQAVEYLGMVTGLGKGRVILSVGQGGSTRELKLAISDTSIFWNMKPCGREDVQPKKFVSLYTASESPGRSESQNEESQAALEVDLRK